jgi:hypothetical protein
MTQKAAERETYDDPDNEKQKTEQSHLQAMTHERKIGAVRQYVHNRQTRQTRQPWAKTCCAKMRGRASLLL